MHADELHPHAYNLDMPDTQQLTTISDRRLQMTLLVLCAASFLDSLDVSMVSIALPSIGSNLDVSTSSLQWVLGGYALGYGGFLLLGGRTADLIGRRRAFLAALAVFVAASLLAALATDGTVLVGARFVTGVSAAFTAPAGLSIITTTFRDGPTRYRALASYTATAASGFSFGLVFGGLLTSIDWRLTFAVPAPIALIALLAAQRLLPTDAPTDRAKGRYDVAGAVTITASMLLLVYGVTRTPAIGWSDAQTVVTLAGSVVVLGVFVLIEQRVAQPLLRLGILRSVALVRANLVMVTIGCFVGFQFVATLYLQGVIGWSALPTALAFLPGGALIALGAPRIGALVTRIGAIRTLVFGMLAFVLGYALYLRIDTDFGYATLMLPTMIFLGIGFVLAYPSANMIATSGVDDREQGLASGLVNTSFQLGGALTLAIVSAVVSSRAHGSTNPRDLLDAFHAALIVIAGGAALGLAVALTGLRRSRPR
jgi:MFS family permease